VIFCRLISCGPRQRSVRRTPLHWQPPPLRSALARRPLRI